MKAFGPQWLMLIRIQIDQVAKWQARSGLRHKRNAPAPKIVLPNK
jgi:hypothetical protein